MKFIALLAIFLLSACTNSERPLRFNLGVESVQLDWNRAIDATSVVLIDNIMEGLTSYSNSFQDSRAYHLQPLPGLASSWSVAEGGTLYKFNLRPNITWTDGRALMAQDFVDSWRRLLEPEIHSPNAYHLFDIVGARAFNEGKEKDFGKVGVRATDALTLEVRLRRPVPYFLHLVASASTYPIRKDLIERFGDQWTNPENLVTLGPYRVAEWLQGDRIALDAFDHYYAGLPPIRQVIVRLLNESLTAYTLFENGELDIIPRDLPPSFARKLAATPDYRTGPRLSVSYLLFNTKRKPFDQPAFRRAFIRAMNRTALAAPFQGTQVPTRSWIPPGLLGYSEEIGIPADGIASKSQPGPEVEIRYSGGDTWNLMFQMIQQDMDRNLGLKAKITQVDANERGDYLSLLSLPQHARSETLPHLMNLGWVADYPDPHSFMNVFTSTSERNYSGWSNEAYDSLVEKAVATDDESMRLALYNRAQKILLEDEAVLMPLFYTSHQALVRSDLRGVQLNVLDKWYFRNMSFAPTGWQGFGRSFMRRFSKSLSPGAS